MPPSNCEKYKQSTPNAECDCQDCEEAELARKEIKKMKRFTIRQKNSQIPPLGKYRFDYFLAEKSGYVYLKNGKIYDTTELVEGKVYLDTNKDGDVLGVEILL